jgi:hypothetical protein
MTMRACAWLIIAASSAIGCALDDSSPVTQPDGGAGNGAGGAGTTSGGGRGATGGGGGASAGTGRGGTAGAAGAAGTMGAGGEAGSSAESGAAGSGGAAGAPDSGDASADIGIDMGFPEASTCAGYAFQFDGTTYATARRLVESDFTLEAWIKAGGPSLTGAQFWNGNGLIYSDLGGMADDFGTSLLNNHFSFGIGNPDTTLESTTTVTTGDWFHVAATRTASTGVVRVFVNGVLEAQQTLANTRPLIAQSTLTLGANTIDGRYFNGWMDEVRVWNVARDATELRATMHERLTGNEPGLLVYWRFDEPGSQLLFDSSSTHENAAVVGLAAWVPSDAPVCEARPDASRDAPADASSPDVTTEANDAASPRPDAPPE